MYEVAGLFQLHLLLQAKFKVVKFLIDITGLSSRINDKDFNEIVVILAIRLAFPSLSPSTRAL
jgi:hypothetical protein